MKIVTTDPLTDPAWAKLLDARPDATVFHSVAWAAVLQDTYGFKPQHLVGLEDDTPVAGIPLFKVGNRLVAAPFSDFCPPLISEVASASDLLDAARATVAESGITSLELRGDGGVDLAAENWDPGDSFIRHVVPLHLGAEELQKRRHDSAKRAVRKAEREGITVRLSTDLADMKRYYRLNVLTRKKHRLIPQPWQFFRNIQRHHVDNGTGWLLLADYQGKTIAGDLLLAHKDTLVYKFNASDPRFLHVRPNNILMNAAINFGLEHGFRDFDLGRCEAENEGLRRFKLLWGADEVPLQYFHFPSLNSVPATGITQNGLARRLLPLFVRVAPTWALSGAGALLYRRFA